MRDPVVTGGSKEKEKTWEDLREERAGDRVRTGDVQLGRLTLYQLSYSRENSDGDGDADGSGG